MEPEAEIMILLSQRQKNQGGAMGARGCEFTFGVGEDDGHEPGAPVGDLDGEVPHLELVHADHLPPAGAGGGLRAQGGGEAQQREEKLRPSHCQPADSLTE